MQLARAELVERISALFDSDGMLNPIPRLRLRRWSHPTQLGQGVTTPVLCVIAQGSKEIRVASNSYVYDTENYLVVTAALPIMSQVTEASEERPFLGAIIELDPMMVGSVMIEARRGLVRTEAPEAAIAVSKLTPELLDAALRLVRLAESPDDAELLAPLIYREITYRLLVGEQHHRLRQIAELGGETNRIAQAIDLLRTNFSASIRMDDLARELGMSVSGFHHHFKIVTAMSPLQFQKHLRLQEAKRLMLGENLDAAGAGYRVGYDDPSHFSRDYKRFFGDPPKRDIARMRIATCIETSPV